MKKFLIICIMFVFCFAGGLWFNLNSVSAEPEVIEITEKAEFQQIASKINSGEISSPNIKLGADIVFEENEFVPIGNAEHAFSGTFDGAGYEITINSNEPSENFGLFGVAENATIKNISVSAKIFLTNEDYNKSYNLGCVVANAKSTKILNCKSDVVLAGKDAENNIVSGSSFGNINFGGIVGHAESSVVSNCYALVEINYAHNGLNLKDANFGGIVGELNFGEITNCYVCPRSETIKNLDGVISNEENLKLVNNSNLCEVNFGGIAGSVNAGVSNVKIVNTMFFGYLNKTATINVGGIVGSLSFTQLNTNNISNSKYFSIKNTNAMEIENAIGNTSGTYVQSSTIETLTAYPLNKEYYLSSSWENFEYAWNFDEVWAGSTIFSGSMIFLPELQQFTEVEISLNYKNDEKILKLSFVDGEENLLSKKFKIGEKVEIKAEFNKEYNEDNSLKIDYSNFYSFNNWLKVENQNVVGQGDVLTFECSYLTAGSYAITYVGKEVEIEIVATNENGEAGNFGQIASGNTKNSSLLLKSNYNDKSKVIKIQAIENLENFKFSHFECGELKKQENPFSFKLDNNISSYPTVVFDGEKLVCKIFAVFTNNTSKLNLIFNGNGSVNLIDNNYEENSELVFVNNKEYTLVASPKEGYKFEGWFNGDELISTNLTINYQINSNSQLTAKFTEINSDNNSKINIWIIIGPIIGAVVLAGIIILIVFKIKNKNKFNYKKNFKY